MIYEDSYNPLISFIDEPIYLEDVIYERYKERALTFYCYTEYDKRKKQYVKHTYAVRNTKASGWQCKEVRRDFENKPSIFRDMYYLDYGCSSGCHPIFNTKKNWYIQTDPSKDWQKIDDYYYSKMPSYNLELNPIENIIANDLDLRYCGFHETSYLDMFEYIKMYRKEPIIEVFMKLGLYRLCLNEKAIEFTKNNKLFRKWLYAHAEECKGMSFQHIKGAFKKNPNGNVGDYYNSLQYRIQCGKDIASQDKELYQELLKHTSQEKVFDYLTENNIGKQSYYDYLTACKWLRLNFDDTKVLFPKDFQKYHDDYTKQYGEYKKQQEIIKNKDKSAAMLKVANKYKFCNYKIDKYIVIIAKTKEDLIDEGAELQHCVGRMNYDDRQIQEQSLICFLRAANNPDKPLVTVEFDIKNKRILQRYGLQDSRPNDDIITFLENEWLGYVKKEFTKHRKELI